MSGGLRDSPTDAFVERLRQRFPTESEFDVLETQKLKRRRDARRPIPSLSTMEGSFRNLLDVHVKDGYDLSHVRWLSGGASKLQMACELRWRDPKLDSDVVDQIVVRMEPQESLNATSRLREFQALRAVAGLLPVPRTFWVDAEARFFPEAALIYEYATGVTKVSGVEGRTSGVGNAFGHRLRPLLGEQFVDHLAKLHSFDYSTAELGAFDVPSPGTTESANWQLNRACRVWDSDRPEEMPVIEVAINWLRRNLPTLDRVSLLHGDYRGGNFLFDEASGNITAWLDWERSYLGDRHRDLAWITLPQFGHFSEDGRTFLVSGLVPIEEFYDRYAEKSGLEVDPERIQYYKILNTFQLIASSHGSAYRVSSLGRSHQDVLLTWIEGVIYSLVEELRLQLLEVGS
ncbi:phosphotransferase family protein [Nocardioides seonyuensis]|uniref:Phosphotransferase family protein n=2 Tax=Nocardioides seonyuensis TaxID=2518371 RepID=A0A4P7IJE6_9ACTN|nr:phosphotransferase family protein [Nocardioides seonyuensis]